MIAGFKAAQAHRLPITALSAHHLQLLDTVLNRLNRQVEQIEQVIDSLLTHVTEHHAHAQHLVACSAASCIDQALADYLFPTAGKPVIHWESPHDFDIKVNPLLIKHVLFNLLKNACYFIRKAGKGQIFIWLEQGSDDNTIHFKDTAMGIKPNHLPHIFDYLYSVDTNQGTGIGLAFCTNVLQAYGGSITCHSVYGQYAEFVLTFPRSP